MSKAFRNSLPESERANAEEELWLKSGAKCFLCGGALNRAADIIEVDHDIPQGEGGKNELINLNLTHRRCNRFKRNHPSINVRPYLMFEAYVEEKGGDVRYDGTLDYFHISAGDVVCEISNGLAKLEFPNGEIRETPIYKDHSGDQEILYAFVELPRAAILNDADCQPRTIKLSHLWSILSDLQLNPLHEPPACRLEQASTSKPQPLLMFDGQHKTVAWWLRGHDHIVAKVYLGMSTKSAIVLVNSIQSKIKKLPLSPFEFNAKLSDEWDKKLSEYEEAVGSVEASEEGFLQWITDPAERRRATEAFKAALIDGVISDPTLEFRKYIAKPSAQRGQNQGIPEATVKGKVLQQLLFLKPLGAKGEAMRQLREREQRNVVRLLNLFTAAAFEVGQNPSPQAEIRAERLNKQASLQYVTNLLKKFVAHVLSEDAIDRVFLEREPDQEQWEKIEAGIQRLIEHPIWTIDLDHSAKTRSVNLAMSMNQNIDDAFRQVFLRLGFVTGVDHVKATEL
ncbi:MAG TPA: HNH endonuclease signature motif containing protein [Allosphingosinicella sp.]